MRKPIIIYCCPVPILMPLDQAYRFVGSWLQAQPLHDCSLIVVSNGGQPTSEMKVLFSAIPNFHGFLEWNNEGWDCGAHFHAARNIAAEMMVFFGSNAWFHRSGWLKRMVEAWNEHGPDHLYGTFASMVSRPHIRTNGYWLSPKLMSLYPWPIRTMDDRYAFEHRDRSITDFVESIGRKALMVTWSGVYSKIHWGQVKEAYMNGTQSEMLLRDKVSDLMCPPP